MRRTLRHSWTRPHDAQGGTVGWFSGSADAQLAGRTSCSALSRHSAMQWRASGQALRSSGRRAVGMCLGQAPRTRFVGCGRGCHLAPALVSPRPRIRWDAQHPVRQFCRATVSAHGRQRPGAGAYGLRPYLCWRGSQVPGPPAPALHWHATAARQATPWPACPTFKYSVFER